MARIDAPASHPAPVVLSSPVQSSPPYFLASRKQRERGGPFAFQPDAAFSSSPLRPENSQSSRFEIGTVPRFQQPIDHETAASLNFISHRYSLETRCGTGCTTDSSLGGNVRQCLEHADRDD